MSVERTILLFRNDILLTIKDAQNKGLSREEVDFRLRSTWKVTLADMGM